MAVPKGFKHSPETIARMKAAQLARKDKRKKTPLADRFWAKVEKRGEDECWPWIGSLMNDPKYRHGCIWDGVRGVISAHRASLIVHGVELIPGLFIDHTCRDGLCVNPKHLRQVTPRVNGTENNSSPFAQNARKTHCAKGHSLSVENIAIKECTGPKGTKMFARICLVCYPSAWHRAAIKREPPPNARKKAWTGPACDPSRWAA